MGDQDQKATATEQRAARRRAEKQKQKKTRKEDNLTFLQRSRGLLDALVFAFVLAMFIRSFVFELFVIPTGSMTPTLIGDSAGQVAILDYDEDGIEDVLYTFVVGGRLRDTVQVYLMNEDGTYKDQIFVENLAQNTITGLVRRSTSRKDMIIVNKFSYWFSAPNRGDIAVFKTPHKPETGNPFDPSKPVYIKRVVGLPEETAAFRPVAIRKFGMSSEDRYGTRLGGTEVHLVPQPVLIDGEPLVDGRFESLIHYPPPTRALYPVPSDQPKVLEIGKDGVLMIGDNSASSLDGRYWGAVPQSHMRGKAVLRYLPFGAAGFLN